MCIIRIKQWLAKWWRKKSMRGYTNFYIRRYFKFSKKILRLSYCHIIHNITNSKSKTVKENGERKNMNPNTVDQIISCNMEIVKHIYIIAKFYLIYYLKLFTMFPSRYLSLRCLINTQHLIFEQNFLQ